MKIISDILIKFECTQTIKMIKSLLSWKSLCIFFCEFKIFLPLYVEFNSEYGDTNITQKMHIEGFFTTAMKY